MTTLDGRDAGRQRDGGQIDPVMEASGRNRVDASEICEFIERSVFALVAVQLAVIQPRSEKGVQRRDRRRLGLGDNAVFVEVDMLGVQNKRRFQAGIVCGKGYFFFVVILIDGERQRVFADMVRNLHTRLSRIEPHIGINHDPDDRIRRRCRDIRVVDQVYPRCRVGYRHDGGGIGGVMEFKRTRCSIKLLSFIVERQVLSSRRVFHLLLYNLQLPGLGTD